MTLQPWYYLHTSDSTVVDMYAEHTSHGPGWFKGVKQHDNIIQALHQVQLCGQQEFTPYITP